MKKTQQKSKTNKTKSKKTLKIEKLAEPNPIEIKSMTAFESVCVGENNVFYEHAMIQEKRKQTENMEQII